jgi:hypothetical protein
MENSGCCGNTNGQYIVPTNIAKTCENPLLYLIDSALVSSNGNVSGLAAEIISILGNGLFLQNKTNLCCPDCSDENGFYYLGDAEAFEAFMTAYKLSPNFSDIMKCCINFSGYTDVSLDIKKIIEESFSNDVPCCNFDFSHLVKTYAPSFFTNINSRGIVEISTLANVSILETLKTRITELYPYATDAFLHEVLSVLLAQGVFIKCIDCGILITNSTNAVTELDKFLDDE